MIGLDELREWLKIPSTRLADNSLIEELEKRAVAFVERQTGYHYGVAGSFVEFVRGTGTDTLYLSRNPTLDPTEVRELTAIGETGTVITAAQSDGWVRRDSRLLRRAGGVWTYGYEYQVTYSAGYAAGEEPGEVRQAVFELVELAYNARGKAGLQSESISGYSWSRADVLQLSPIAQAVLGNRRVRV